MFTTLGYTFSNQATHSSGHISCNSQNMYDLFRLCPPVRYAPAVREHATLNSKSLCKNIALASGGANNTRSLSWRDTNGKDLISVKIPKWREQFSWGLLRERRKHSTRGRFYP